MHARANTWSALEVSVLRVLDGLIVAVDEDDGDVEVVVLELLLVGV